MPTLIHVLLLAVCALVVTSCSSSDGEDKESGEALTEQQKSARCDAARTSAADAYALIDRACTQDSDCEAKPIGGCGCPVPVSASANVSMFEEATTEAKKACDEYYVAPGASACLNNVICTFGSLESGKASICNAQGMCDEPPEMDGESM